MPRSGKQSCCANLAENILPPAFFDPVVNPVSRPCGLWFYGISSYLACAAYFLFVFWTEWSKTVVTTDTSVALRPVKIYPDDVDLVTSVPLTIANPLSPNFLGEEQYFQADAALGIKYVDKGSKTGDRFATVGSKISSDKDTCFLKLINNSNMCMEYFKEFNKHAVCKPYPNEQGEEGLYLESKLVASDNDEVEIFPQLILRVSLNKDSTDREKEFFWVGAEDDVACPSCTKGKTLSTIKWSDENDFVFDGGEYELPDNYFNFVAGDKGFIQSVFYGVRAQTCLKDKRNPDELIDACNEYFETICDTVELSSAPFAITSTTERSATYQEAIGIAYANFGFVASFIFPIFALMARFCCAPKEDEEENRSSAHGIEMRLSKSSAV